MSDGQSWRLVADTRRYIDEECIHGSDHSEHDEQLDGSDGERGPDSPKRRKVSR